MRVSICRSMSTLLFVELRRPLGCTWGAFGCDRIHASLPVVCMVPCPSLRGEREIKKYQIVELRRPSSCNMLGLLAATTYLFVYNVCVQTSLLLCH